MLFYINYSIITIIIIIISFSYYYITLQAVRFLHFISSTSFQYIRCLCVTFAAVVVDGPLLLLLLLSSLLLLFIFIHTRVDTKLNGNLKKKCSLGIQNKMNDKWCVIIIFFNLGTIVTQMSRFTTIILVQKIRNVPTLTKEYHISCTAAPLLCI